MVQRYSVSLYDEEIYQDDDGTFVYYFDYAALEQRFDALSTKFSALVEENATLRKRLEPIETAAIALVQRLELDKDVKKNNWWLNERAKIMEVIDDNEGCDEN